MPHGAPYLSKPPFRLCAAIFLLGWFAIGWHASAQTIPAPAIFSAEAQRVWMAGDALLFPATTQTIEGRRDAQSGILRAGYRLNSTSPPAGSSAQEAGQFFLQQSAATFGLPDDLAGLEVVSVRETPDRSHITYQQMVDGVPVYQGRIHLNLNRERRPTIIFNQYRPSIDATNAPALTPSLSDQEALGRAEAELGSSLTLIGTADLMIYPAESPALIWRLRVAPASYHEEWEVIVDAHTGNSLRIIPLHTHLETNAPASTVTVERPPRPQAIAQADGRGLVFDPDPLSTAGRLYGAPYDDQGDADSPELTNELFSVDLLDITLGADGLYRLIGPHVDITGSTGSLNVINYTPPAEPSPDAFQYTRSNSFFEGVNVYYHIDKSQRYVQSLNIGHDTQNAPIRVNPHGLGGSDESKYFPANNMILFGLGNVDDAEDAGVIWHEYGHALLEGSAPDLLVTLEGRALHEGWADYWAASYARALTENGTLNRSDWRTLFKWDTGDGDFWAGRTIAFEGQYPEDTGCDGRSFSCNIYDDGLLWATVLMEIQDGIGREATDVLALASHAYLLAPTTFRDAAEAIIQADLDLFNGDHADLLFNRFNDRGLIDVNQFGPVVSHTPLPSTEQLGGEANVEVIALGITSSVDQVNMVYGVDGPLNETLPLTLDGGNRYTGVLPLPSTPSTVIYRIDVEDQNGLTVSLPRPPDASTYSFTTGPDVEPPIINHTPLPNLNLVDWPAVVATTVDDRIGVDTVYVDYAIEDGTGAPIASGSFGLTPKNEALFTGAFPEIALPSGIGSRVEYAITALDKAAGKNESRLPASDFFSFDVIVGRTLRQYDFEQTLNGIATTGSWTRTTPDYVLKTAHSGSQAWGTAPDTAYAGDATLSTFQLPPINLQGVDTSYLVFWHWHDFEHSNQGMTDAAYWDGGNVKVSTDGSSWSPVMPLSDYTGQIANGRENPLQDEPAFGGFSYGWRRSVVPLPTDDEIHIRFDFGTDASNSATSVGLAGWWIDDVSIVTSLETDSIPPTIFSSFPNVTIVDAGASPVPFSIAVRDNVGIEQVRVAYETEQEGIRVADTLRLAMDVENLAVFTGSFPDASIGTLGTGDRIHYRVLVEDVNGLVTATPAMEEPAYQFEYRLRDRIDVLASANPTGYWQPVDEGWIAVRQSSDDEETPISLSALVMGPYDLPTNVDQLALQLVVEANMNTTRLGGNIKLAGPLADDWQVIEPINRYPRTFPEGDVLHPMNEEPAFNGSFPQAFNLDFDLLPYKGEQIWLRIDMGAIELPAGSDFWKIEEGMLVYSTLEEVNGGFDIPLALTLHPNYPDPFRGQTTLSYTLPEASEVQLDVYDVLGRRIAVLVDTQQPAGTYSLTFDGSNLSAGMYFLRLQTPNAQQIERMLVNR